MFQIFHGLSHSSAKTTMLLIKKKYIWPSVNRDVKIWSKGCIHCQSSMVGRHVHVKPANFAVPLKRFRHVHIDIIGPLSRIADYRYCLTLVDRFSRWPEAIPLRDISAQTVCRALVDGWITRFGCPETLTSDRGTQFEARLFTELRRVVGCNRIRTTSYHPDAYGMVERFHRTLKAEIMYHSDTDWPFSLSTVLMGLRVNVMENGSSPPEYVYGTTLRVPGELVVAEEGLADPQQFVSEFRRHMHEVRTAPVKHNSTGKFFVHKELAYCTHVFLRAPPNKK